ETSLALIPQQVELSAHEVVRVVGAELAQVEDEIALPLVEGNRAHLHLAVLEIDQRLIQVACEANRMQAVDLEVSECAAGDVLLQLPEPFNDCRLRLGNRERVPTDHIGVTGDIDLAV